MSSSSWLIKLHWLPIHQRFNFVLSTLTLKYLTPNSDLIYHPTPLFFQIHLHCRFLQRLSPCHFWHRTEFGKLALPKGGAMWCHDSAPQHTSFRIRRSWVQFTRMAIFHSIIQQTEITSVVPINVKDNSVHALLWVNWCANRNVEELLFSSTVLQNESSKVRQVTGNGDVLTELTNIWNINNFWSLPRTSRIQIRLSH